MTKLKSFLTVYLVIVSQARDFFHRGERAPPIIAIIC